LLVVLRPTSWVAFQRSTQVSNLIVSGLGAASLMPSRLRVRLLDSWSRPQVRAAFLVSKPGSLASVPSASFYLTRQGLGPLPRFSAYAMGCLSARCERLSGWIKARSPSTGRSRERGRGSPVSCLVARSNDLQVPSRRGLGARVAMGSRAPAFMISAMSSSLNEDTCQRMCKGLSVRSLSSSAPDLRQ
jgi:hypothetical protein